MLFSFAFDILLLSFSSHLALHSVWTKEVKVTPGTNWQHIFQYYRIIFL